jgi:hypothetical protein
VLDAREQGVCGNGIVEADAGEDCDGENGCFAPEALAECFWSCGPESDDCPDGFACGLDGVCRQPGLDFERGDAIGTARVVWVESIDLDGDGRDDLVAIEAEEAAPDGTLSVTFFDEARDVAARWEWPNVRAQPQFGDLDGDGLTDIALTVQANGDEDGGAEFPEPDLQRGGVVVLRNDGQRGFRPLVAAGRWANRDSPELLDPRPAYLAGRDVPIVRHFGIFHDMRPGGDEEYWLGPASERELVYNRAASEYYPCHTPRAAQLLTDQDIVVFTYCNDKLEQTHTVFAQIDDQSTTTRFDGNFDPVFSDINADGHADLVAKMNTYPDNPEDSIQAVVASFGVADGSFHSDPNALPGENGDGGFSVQTGLLWLGGYEMPDGAMPVFADLNDDGLLDFLMPSAVAITEPFYCDPEQMPCLCGPHARCLAVDGARLWQEGHFVDVDGDGDLDVVGTRIGDGGGQTVSVLLASPNGFFESEAQTGDRNPLGLSLGDFDGDSQTDVGVWLGSVNEVDDQLAVLWGGTASTELQVAAFGIAIADGPRTQGFTASTLRRDRLLALTGKSSDASGETGLIQFIEDADRRLVAPVRADVGAVKRAFVTRAGAQARDELVLATDQGRLERKELALENSGVLSAIDRGISGPYDDSSTYFVHADWLRDVPGLAGDVDADGVDDIVIAGPTTATDPPIGSTAVRVLSPATDGWNELDKRSTNAVSIGGVWPTSDHRSQTELIDVDQDGHLDLFSVAWIRAEGQYGYQTTTDRRTPMVMFNDGLGAFFDPQFVTDGETRLPDLRTWSFIGAQVGARWRVLIVDGEHLRIGWFDGEEGTLHLPVDQTAPADVTWSDSGDLDGDGLGDVAVATGSGIVMFWGQPAHGSADDDDSAGDDDGYQDPPEGSEGGGLEDPAAVIFVNFDGATLVAGSDDARTNTTSISQLAGVFQPFGSGPKRAEIFQRIQTDFEPFNVLVVDDRPIAGDYTMLMIGPSNPFGGGVLGIAPLDCENQQTPNNITFTFGSENDTNPAILLANVGSGRIGPTYGLENTINMNDLSAGSSLSDQDVGWTDQCIQIAQGDVCPHWDECPSGQQNSYRELLALFGPRE